jgi:predicted DNA-binding protein
MEKTLDLVDVVYPERENWISSTTVSREFVLSRLHTIGENAEKYFNLAWTVGASIETVIDKMEDFVLEVQIIYSEIKEGENK